MSGAISGMTFAITGAAGGIGQWLCRIFGEEGAAIAAIDRSDKVSELASALGKEGIAVQPVVVDIADDTAVRSVIATLGDVHILINNAGISRHPTYAKA